MATFGTHQLIHIPDPFFIKAIADTKGFGGAASKKIVVRLRGNYNNGLHPSWPQTCPFWLTREMYSGSINGATVNTGPWHAYATEYRFNLEIALPASSALLPADYLKIFITGNFSTAVDCAFVLRGNEGLVGPQSDGKHYRCIKSHTSSVQNRPPNGTVTDAWKTYWKEVTDGRTGSAWVDNTAYYQFFEVVNA